MADEELTELFERDAGLGVPEVSDRDMATAVLEMDYEQQLVAITGLLRRNREADKQLEAEREKIAAFLKKSSGPLEQQAEDDCGANFHAAVYQDAAHSMAAVGMLAPMSNRYSTKHSK